MELDYQRICRKALGTLRRRGVTAYIEAEELTSVGYVALAEAKPATEALGVTIARRAMIDAVRRNERRQRGRVEVRGKHSVEADGWEETEGDQWDITVYGKQRIRPENAHADLWELLKALPSREYLVVTLHFWGNRTQADIAGEGGLSQQRVGQILKAALEKMKHALVNESGTRLPIGGKETHRTVLSSRKDAA